MIADLTGNRGGVYYEAGFALALNIPVNPDLPARLPRRGSDEWLERIHFDMKHLNLISWTPDKLPELTERLKNRIEAVLGRGPA